MWEEDVKTEGKVKKKLTVSGHQFDFIPTHPLRAGTSPCPSKVVPPYSRDPSRAVLYSCFCFVSIKYWTLFLKSFKDNS